ncbi:MAG TPA: hypothetical protein VJW55_19520 [Candidatus Angelobacter sp.]|nr:hypothetical protein [Candidatus Angelobacter sp.]
MVEGIKKNEIEGNLEQAGSLADQIIGLLARIVGLGSIKHISQSIGTADLEMAYQATLDRVGTTNATQLIDLSIRLDHFGEIPIATIQELHKKFDRLTFADTVLMDMIAYHFSMFDVDRKIMQRVVSIFRADKGTPTIDASKLMQYQNKK